MKRPVIQVYVQYYSREDAIQGFMLLHNKYGTVCPVKVGLGKA